MKAYQTPKIRIEVFESEGLLMQGSNDVNKITTNTDINYAGSDKDYSGPVRVKDNSHSVWDDDWSK